MQLAVAVIVFLAIAIVVMILYCIITKYFNYKMQKALQQGNEVYSAIDQFHDRQDQCSGQYDEYIRKRQGEEVKSKSKKDKEYYDLLDNEAHEPLKYSAGNDLYGISRLKKRLNGETIPLKPQTARSINTMRSFKPQKLDTNRSNLSKNQFAQKDSPNNNRKPDVRRLNDKKKQQVPQMIQMQNLQFEQSESEYPLQPQFKQTPKNSKTKPQQGQSSGNHFSQKSSQLKNQQATENLKRKSSIQQKQGKFFIDQFKLKDQLNGI